MEKIKYFDKPTQIAFCDEEGTWQFGIAYCGEIICSCCGSVFDIEEVYEFAPAYIHNPIYPYNSWVNLSDEIRGGELPNGLDEDNCCNIIEVSE